MLERGCVAVLFFSLIACEDSSPRSDDAGADASDDATPDACWGYACDPRIDWCEDAPDTPMCPEDEIEFCRADGCTGDGAVEFCIPDDDDVVADVEAIDSQIHCAPGGGRAGCNNDDLLLCTYPAEDNCEEQALTEEAWAAVCAFAALPEVTRIVLRFYE